MRVIPAVSDGNKSMHFVYVCNGRKYKFFFSFFLTHAMINYLL